ncbi:hypothetical protein GCM10011512_07700 [Tersicoccus solisilvae]|uniref:Uncharacterized protein n=1 Tax=Tersicoccus solisilvae TaxID=1882339 RepID=A0ABQ1NR58_9MICC|nr:hypothetical protein [Tersicoccus solisilvae]GGC83396.1 hypothetical protein GCM10011512_07700 [Tersicoccus solisilvae]
MTKRITIRTQADLLALMELTAGRRPPGSLLVQGMTRNGAEVGPTLRLDLPQHVEGRCGRAGAAPGRAGITAGRANRIGRSHWPCCGSTAGTN